MSSSIYQHYCSPLSTNIVRLLRLDQRVCGSPDDQDLPKALHCPFEIHSFDHTPKFVALSYEWASETLVEGVLTVDGQEWTIRENLCDAILHILGRKSSATTHSLGFNKRETDVRRKAVRILEYSQQEVSRTPRNFYCS
jgi:hypothetical protein